MNNIDIEKYKSIINLPHHVSKKHPQMSLYERAAQFAPFAALTGFEDEVEETARLTDEKIETDEEIRKVLDRRLQQLKEKIRLNPKIEITYFVPDLRKTGGRYYKKEGIVKKIDEYGKNIVFEDKTIIKIQDIIKIEGINIKLD